MRYSIPVTVAACCFHFVENMCEHLSSPSRAIDRVSNWIELNGTMAEKWKELKKAAKILLYSTQWNHEYVIHIIPLTNGNRSWHSYV